MNWSGSSLKFKLGITLGLIIMAFYLPWWITFIALVLLVIILPNFYPALIIGLVLDLTYGYQPAMIFHFPLPFTLILIIIYFLAPAIKSRLNLNVV